MFDLPKDNGKYQNEVGQNVSLYSGNRQKYGGSATGGINSVFYRWTKRKFRF